LTSTAREIIRKHPQLFVAAQGIMQQCEYYMCSQTCLICLSRELEFGLQQISHVNGCTAQYLYAGLFNAGSDVRLHAIDTLLLLVITSYSHGNVQDLQMLPYGQSRCMQVLIGSKVRANAGCCLLCGAPSLQ